MNAKHFLEQQIASSGLSRKDWYRQVYLKSEHWHNLRQMKFDFSGRFCSNCQARDHLDVHHKNYKNLYDVTIFDLEVLCRRCHKAEHGVVETYRDYESRNKVVMPRLDTLSDVKAFYREAKKTAIGNWKQRLMTAYNRTLAVLTQRGNITDREQKWLDCVLSGLGGKASKRKKRKP